MVLVFWVILIWYLLVLGLGVVVCDFQLFCECVSSVCVAVSLGCFVLDFVFVL